MIMTNWIELYSHLKITHRLQYVRSALLEALGLLPRLSAVMHASFLLSQVKLAYVVDISFFHA